MNREVSQASPSLFLRADVLQSQSCHELSKLGIQVSTVYSAENTARANPVEGETETTR